MQEGQQTRPPAFTPAVVEEPFRPPEKLLVPTPAVHRPEDAPRIPTRPAQRPSHRRQLRLPGGPLDLPKPPTRRPFRPLERPALDPRQRQLEHVVEVHRMRGRPILVQPEDRFPAVKPRKDVPPRRSQLTGQKRQLIPRPRRSPFHAEPIANEPGGVTRAGAGKPAVRQTAADRRHHQRRAAIRSNLVPAGTVNDPRTMRPKLLEHGQRPRPGAAIDVDHDVAPPAPGRGPAPPRGDGAPPRPRRTAEVRRQLDASPGSGPPGRAPTTPANRDTDRRAEPPSRRTRRSAAESPPRPTRPVRPRPTPATPPRPPASRPKRPNRAAGRPLVRRRLLCYSCPVPRRHSKPGPPRLPPPPAVAFV